jgi:hypothetical protein
LTADVEEYSKNSDESIIQASKLSIKLITGKLNIPPGKALPGAIVSHTSYNCGRCISFQKRKGHETTP